MTVQHLDIYHCLKCGKLVYRAHNERCPRCCGEDMVRAVTDVDCVPDEGRPRSVPAPSREFLRTMQREHRHLLQQVAAVLTRWDVSVDPEAADFGETRLQLGDLRAELAEHFSEEENEGYLSGALSAAPRFSRWATQLRKQHVEFLEELDRLTRNLRSEEPESWKETRSDFERLADQIRRHEGAENAIVQAAFGDDVGAAD